MIKPNQIKIYFASCKDKIKRILRYIHACPLRHFTSCAHFSLVTKLLIILHPTMPSGNTFHKFTVGRAKKYFLMSNLAKMYANLIYFP